MFADTPPGTEIWGEAEEERAAIIEYDGGAPRTWAEALAHLDASRPPDACRRQMRPG
jgi:hypothetical protein